MTNNDTTTGHPADSAAEQSEALHPDDLRPLLRSARWTQTAEKTVGERRPVHGAIGPNMRLTARLWSAYIEGLYMNGQDGLSDKDVCALNILQKMSRDVTARELNPDNWIDVCGYVLCIQELTETQARRRAEADAERIL